MNECKLFNVCQLFKGTLDPEIGLGAIYRKRYCLEDCTQCARYIITEVLGIEKVPPTMYPNMLDHARSLINAKS